MYIVTAIDSHSTWTKISMESESLEYCILKSIYKQCFQIKQKHTSHTVFDKVWTILFSILSILSWNKFCFSGNMLSIGEWEYKNGVTKQSVGPDPGQVLSLQIHSVLPTLIRTSQNRLQSPFSNT